MLCYCQHLSCCLMMQYNFFGLSFFLSGCKHKGKKTQIMKAMERGINMLIQHDKDATAAEADQRLNKEHMAWERVPASQTGSGKSTS